MSKLGIGGAVLVATGLLAGPTCAQALASPMLVLHVPNLPPSLQSQSIVIVDPNTLGPPGATLTPNTVASSDFCRNLSDEEKKKLTICTIQPDQKSSPPPPH